MVVLIILSIEIVAIVIFVAVINNRTNKLRKDPKVGMTVRYYIGEEKRYGKITQVFKDSVRVGCAEYIYKNDYRPIKGNEIVTYANTPLKRNWINVKRSDLHAVIY